jgi:sigma-B regulation protein RsbU (phosphoserine phosphatase)
MPDEHDSNENIEYKILRHDLYNPINQIVGYSELLSEELDAGESIDPQDLNKIGKSARTLLEMIRSRLTESELQSESHKQSKSEEPSSVIHLKTEASSYSSASRRVEQSARKGKILVVDDDPYNRDLLVQTLSRDGHILSTAENGEIALEMISSQAFDLVLLDIQMPGIDGHEVLRLFKGSQETALLPAIMISGLEDIDLVVECIEIGADDYLPKPCNLTLLRARVYSSLEKKFRYDEDLALYRDLKQTQASIREQLVSAQKLASELSSDDDNEVTIERLRQHFASMSTLLLEKDSALHETIQKLEVKISRQSVATQVRAITSDPAFKTLSERARLMRQRRQERGA